MRRKTTEEDQRPYSIPPDPPRHKIEENREEFSPPSLSSVRSSPLAAWHIVDQNGRMEDDELARRARDGDRSAYEQLIARHDRQLAAWLMRQVRQSADVDDVLQEIFLKAWKSANTYRGEASVAVSSGAFVLDRIGVVAIGDTTRSISTKHRNRSIDRA